MGVLIALLIIWAGLIVLGLLVKGMFWLVVVGAILVVTMGIVGFVKRDTLGRR